MMGTQKGISAQQYGKHPFREPVEEIKTVLGTDTESGLSRARISELQKQYGENKLAGQGGVKWYAVLLKQISNAMILVSFEFFPSIREKSKISPL